MSLVLRITPERARRIEEAIRQLRIVKAHDSDNKEVDDQYKQVASDVLIDLYDDWKQLQDQPLTMDQTHDD